MKTSVSKSIYHALVISEADLKCIAQIIEDEYGELRISADCIDGSTITPNSLSELVDFDNPSFRRIKSLTIRADRSREKYCELSIEDSLFSTASFSIEDSDEKRLLKVSKDLTAHLQECRPYYSTLAKVSFTTAVAGVLFAIGVIFYWARWFRSEKSLAATSGWSFEEFMFAFIPLVIVGGMVMKNLDRAWDWLVPKIWFAIGRQKAEHEKRAKVRTWLFGATVLAIAGIVLRQVGDIIRRH
jgi:hypothetical protein